MSELRVTWPWISMVLLGAFHGLNPAMGWLFAVAIGFQERRLRSVVVSLGPITLGHALSIGVIAVPVGMLGLVIPREILLTAIGLTLLGFAGYKFLTRFRHRRWVGMRVRQRELIVWSFLMATAHGAGLMLAPVIARMREQAVPTAFAEDGNAGLMLRDGHQMLIRGTQPSHAGHQMSMGGDALGAALASVALHSAGMFIVAAVIAVVVYQKVGVDVLRRAWINLDLVWFGAFVIAGGVTLGFAIWPLLAR
jgi:hypothetical protein